MLLFTLFVRSTYGKIMHPLVIQMFDEFESKFETAVTSKIDSKLLAIQNSNRGRLGDGVGNEGNRKGSEMVKRGSQGHMWTYRGRFWSVPENFQLPKKVRRRRAWEL